MAAPCWWVRATARPSTPRTNVKSSSWGVWCAAGEVCQHARTFVADPSARTAVDQVIHECGECRPVLLVEVGDNGAVKHHDDAMLGRGVDLRPQRFEQVPCYQGGRILAGNGDRIDQSLAPLFLFGPDQYPQPIHGVLIRDVERGSGRSRFASRLAKVL